MKKYQGMILINTLLMISVLALIVLSQMQLIFLQLKAMNELISRHEDFRELEVATKQLKTHTTNGTGFIPVSNSDEIIARLKNRKGSAFTLHNRQYQFFIEDLGEFPCMEIMINSRLYTARHQRLTVALLNDSPLILQERVAVAGEYIACENKKPVRIKPGLLSWRYFG